MHKTGSVFGSIMGFEGDNKILGPINVENFRIK
jgi:hypothetical protein